MYCFYHADLDGICSAAILNHFIETKKIICEKGIKFVAIDYKDDFPYLSIEKNEAVYLLDFSLKNDNEFQKLNSVGFKITWIDHHITAIEKCPLSDKQLVGIRNINYASCELTWKYFFRGKDIPLAVRYAGRYDVWDFSQYGEKLNYFQAGIKLIDHGPTDVIWKKLFKSHTHRALNKILDEGKIALKYRDNYYKSIIKKNSFMSDFENYTAICCNASIANSQLFDSVNTDYDIMIPFCYDGEKWTVSLYTKKDIDVSEIAKKYGGGGHKRAAGFVCKELPFKKKDKQCETEE